MGTRTDVLTAQHFQVALVFKKMLGLEEAIAYLRSARVEQHLIDRVLLSDNHRHFPYPSQSDTGNNARND